MYTIHLKTLLILPILAISTPAGSEDIYPELGKPATDTEVQRWNISVFADGTGLPPGSGSVSSGRQLFGQYCSTCHAVDGSGGSGDRLAHGGSLVDPYPEKTIGNYWPYTTTLFDFIRRSKPMHQPGSLNDDEVYALTAYLLFLNDMLEESEMLDQNTLPLVTMPNAGGFIDAWQDDPLNSSD